jgi:hypothetical protein
VTGFLVDTAPNILSLPLSLRRRRRDFGSKVKPRQQEGWILVERRLHWVSTGLCPVIPREALCAPEPFPRSCHKDPDLLRPR